MSLKVLHLIDSGGLYGAENMLLDLVDEQQRQGLQPLILSAGTPDAGEKPLEAQARRRGLPAEPFRMRAGLNFRKGMEVLRFAQREGFDILHSHGYKFNILLGCIARRKRGLPLLTTVHGYVHARPFSKMHINQMVDRWSLRRLDAVVFVSRETMRTARLALANAAVIHNGISTRLPPETAVTDAEQQLATRLEAAGKVLGAFGRLTAEKGFTYLLAAFREFRVQHPDALLVIWGEGYLRGDLESEVRQLHIEDAVVMPGYTANVSFFLGRTDLLLLPSLTEGLPIILLEAMKYRVPVVASAVGSVPEVLDQGRCGMIVPPADTPALLGAITAACADPAQLRAMAERAHERLEMHFSSQVMAAAYLELYWRLVDGGRNGEH